MRCAVAALALLGAACAERGDPPGAGGAPPLAPPADAPGETFPEPPVLPAGPRPGPARGRGAAAVRENEGCVGCHAAEARAWSASRHRTAHTNATYQRALALDGGPFCQGCHAPEAPGRAPPDRPTADLGVGCVTCHVVEPGTVLGGPARGASAAPHPVLRPATFAAAGGAGACASCHEFRFPSGGGSDDGAFMQTTIREHARSSGAATPCVDCHMPRGADGRRDHGFSNVRDPAWLRAALDASAARLADGALRVTLAQRAPGHAFPTGDLFRRLEIGCGPATGPASARVHLARHWRPGARGRELARDDRLFDDPVDVDLDCRGASRWWVRLQRVLTPGPDDDPRDDRLDGEVELHGGPLP